MNVTSEVENALEEWAKQFRSWWRIMHQASDGRNPLAMSIKLYDASCTLEKALATAEEEADKWWEERNKT